MGSFFSDLLIDQTVVGIGCLDVSNLICHTVYSCRILLLLMFYGGTAAPPPLPVKFVLDICVGETFLHHVLGSNPNPGAMQAPSFILYDSQHSWLSGERDPPQQTAAASS